MNVSVYFVQSLHAHILINNYVYVWIESSMLVDKTMAYTLEDRNGHNGLWMNFDEGA